MKIKVPIILPNLVTSLLSFFVLLQKPKTRTKFLASWWSVAKNISIYLQLGRAQLQRHEEVNKR